LQTIFKNLYNDKVCNFGHVVRAKNGYVNSILGFPEGSERTWEENVNDNSVGKKGGLSVSKIDFVGLDFSDNKKTRGLPPGLVPFTDSFLDSDLPEVELIVGNADNFNAKTIAPQPEQTMEDESDLYKPKVSTWGVFPRPGNISKTVWYLVFSKSSFKWIPT
jgi:hypothetical protein